MYGVDREDHSIALEHKTKLLSPNEEWDLERFKGSGHYWWLLKVIVSIKTYLVTSNGVLLIVSILWETAPSEVT